MGLSPNPPGVRIFPPEAQFMGPQDCDVPRTRTPKSIKRRVRVRAGLKLFWSSFFSPLFSGRAVFGYLASIVGLFLVIFFFDERVATDSASKIAVGIVSAVVASAIWAIALAISTPYRLRKQESSVGAWSGDRFVYKEPKLILTKEWKSGDNGNYPLFPCPDAYPDSLIDYRIEIDGPSERMNCIIVGAYYIHPIVGTLQSARFDARGRVRLRKDRQLGLACYSRPDTLPAIVRVYMLAWEIDPTTQLDYTDLSTQTRIVLRPS
jgi:hypothetical protein